MPNCKVDLFHDYDVCDQEARVAYVPRGRPDMKIPLCVEHAKLIAQEYIDAEIL